MKGQKMDLKNKVGSRLASKLDDECDCDLDNLDLILDNDLAAGIRYAAQRRYPRVWSSKNLVAMWDTRERIRKVIKSTVKSDVMNGTLVGINGNPKFVIKDVNLSEIARGTGLSVAEISRIFSMKRQPSLISAQKIARFIGSRIGRKFTMDDLISLIIENSQDGDSVAA